MLQKLVKCLMILSLGVKCSDGMKNDAKIKRSENEERIIIDVIRYYEKPTAVVAKVCWGMSDKLKLAEKVMHTGKAKTVQFIEKISAIERSSAEDVLIILDLNCLDNGDFLVEANKNNKFEKPYRWMLLPNSAEDNIDDVLSKLNKASILIDSEVLVANKMKDNEAHLCRVYKIDATSDFIIETFGMWSHDIGLVVSKEAKVSIPVRRKNLRGKRIGMSTVITEDRTKTEIYNLNNIGTDTVSKSSFHNILPLYGYMNATLELLFTDTWGYYINNTWNGMIGQIERGDAELCGTVLLIRQNRAEKLSFLTQPIPTILRFVFREPPLSLQNNLFYLPFRTTVWMCLGALIVLLIFVIYLTARWEMEKNETKSDDPTTLRPDVTDVAIFVAGAVVQQSSSCELKGSLGRAVTFIMFLILLFLYTSYSANIVALLQSSSDQIRTLSDLLNSKFELGVEDQPYTRHYFTTATDPVRKAIYDKKVSRTGYKPNFMPIEEGVKKLQNIGTPFAFHMNAGVGYRFVERFFLEHEKCGLREIEYIPNSMAWLSCRKQSPYKEIYKIGLARILEHGIGDRINRLIFARKPSCTSRSGSFGSVSMMDVYPVLLSLLYGMIAAVTLLALEILVYKRQMKKVKMESKSAASHENISDGYDGDDWVQD